LKSKLAESRVVAEDREEFEAAETPVDQAESIRRTSATAAPPSTSAAGMSPSRCGAAALPVRKRSGFREALTPAVNPRATFHW
jgi:hypothetical protein